MSEGVGEWVIVSDFGDNYRISELASLFSLQKLGGINKIWPFACYVYLCKPHWPGGIRLCSSYVAMSQLLSSQLSLTDCDSVTSIVITSQLVTTCRTLQTRTQSYTVQSPTLHTCILYRNKLSTYLAYELTFAQRYF